MRAGSEKKETEGNKWWGQDDNSDRKMAVCPFLSVSSHFVVCYRSLSSHHSRFFFLPSNQAEREMGVRLGSIHSTIIVRTSVCFFCFFFFISAQQRDKN